MYNLDILKKITQLSLTKTYFPLSSVLIVWHSQ